MASVSDFFPELLLHIADLEQHGLSENLQDSPLTADQILKD
jgi:hypothetical protein